ncbi:zinc finger protein 22-like [Malaclemys terrapin pileata]|uniref:zinc finger protein 22-like n=1 Tax=Malaclemys terrapin pileata TaxID=2991368 RepID=UPI0023A79515|nr:zinc finger protein 22-like [Malaclemys terrapin pileata]
MGKVFGLICPVLRGGNSQEGRESHLFIFVFPHSSLSHSSITYFLLSSHPLFSLPPSLWERIWWDFFSDLRPHEQSLIRERCFASTSPRLSFSPGQGINHVRTPIFIPASDSTMSENEEEKPNQEDLEQDGLSRPAEAQSPGWGKARPERQQRKRCMKSAHQARGSKKLKATLNQQKPPREESPYICTECGKSFKGSSTFLNHLKIHTGEKPFECPKCGKSFSRKANLVVHERIHTGERPYKCKECEKSFGRSSNLIAHRKTHMKKKSYACAACSKSFTCSSALVQHQKSHTEEKPYKCTECRKSFRLSSNFLKHQKVHVRETSSECATVCHEEQQNGGAEQVAMDQSRLILEECKCKKGF